MRPAAEAKKQAEGEKAAKSAQDKAAAAIAQATGEPIPASVEATDKAPAGVDPETGEIKNSEQPKEQKKTTTKK